MAVGTYLIRFSFLGPLGRVDLPKWALRMLRYTPVAVLPGMVAPMILWPAATNGETDPARIMAAFTVAALGIYTKNVLVSIFGGIAVLYLSLYLIG